MQIIRVIMGKVPTIVVTGRPERVCRAKQPRSGNLVVGLAYLGSRRRRHDRARAREVEGLPLTRLAPFPKVLENIGRQCRVEQQKLRAKLRTHH